MSELFLRPSAIAANPDNIQDELNQEAIDELAASIKALGQLQPISIYRGAQGQWTVLLGMRRWLAMSQLAKLDTNLHVRCQVVDQPREEIERLDKMFAENHDRENLNPIEEAKVYKRYLDLPLQPRLTQAAVSERLGVHPSRISTFIKLLDFSLTMQRQIASGEMTVQAASKMMTTIRKTAGVAHGHAGVHKYNSSVPYFNNSHAQHDASQERCSSFPDHAERQKLGGACGECWERVIVLASQRDPNAPRANEPSPEPAYTKLVREIFPDIRTLGRRLKCQRCGHPAFGEGEKQCSFARDGKRFLLQNHEYSMLVAPKES